MTKVPYNFVPVVLKYQEETKDLVSVIIPIYNTELYIRQTLDSLIAQTFENWEAVLVDDGSTDESPKICIEYSEKDSRFKYIRKNNQGALWARKTGLENSRGEFIACLDSDDAYSPQYLEKMFAKIKDGNNDFVYCNFEDLNGKEKFMWGKPFGAKNCKLTENKLENCYNMSGYFRNNLWNKLVKRNIYAKVLFPEIITFGEDVIQTLQIIYHSEKAEFIPDSLLLYRINSITSASSPLSSLKKEKHKVQYVIYAVAIYMLMERFFGACEAEKFFADGAFANYFLLSKKTILHHKIEYAENFVPAFLRGLKNKRKNFFYKIIFILAYRGFTIPLIICRRVQNIFWRAKNVFV